MKSSCCALLVGLVAVAIAYPNDFCNVFASCKECHTSIGDCTWVITIDLMGICINKHRVFSAPTLLTFSTPKSCANYMKVKGKLIIAKQNAMSPKVNKNEPTSTTNLPTNPLQSTVTVIALEGNLTTATPNSLSPTVYTSQPTTTTHLPTNSPPPQPTSPFAILPNSEPTIAIATQTQVTSIQPKVKTPTKPTILFTPALFSVFNKSESSLNSTKTVDNKIEANEKPVHNLTEGLIMRNPLQISVARLPRASETATPISKVIISMDPDSPPQTNENVTKVSLLDQLKRLYCNSHAKYMKYRKTNPRSKIFANYENKNPMRNKSNECSRLKKARGIY